MSGVLTAPEGAPGTQLLRELSAADLPARPQGAIQKIRYSHDAMIDMIVGNPWISQGELARNFGYTEGWVSQVIASDAFQARLAERKNELVDPHLRATIEERYKGVIVRSLEVLMKKLEKPVDQIDDDLLIKGLDVASRAAGYGARAAQVEVKNNFVVQIPTKAASPEDWARAHAPQSGGGQVVDVPSEAVPSAAPALVAPDPAPQPPAAALLVKGG